MFQSPICRHTFFKYIRFDQLNKQIMIESQLVFKYKLHDKVQIYKNQDIDRNPEQELRIAYKLYKNHLKRYKERKQYRYFSIASTNISYIPRQSSSFFSKLTNIFYVDMSDCYLKSLEYFPIMKQLKRLDLTNNRLVDHQIQYILYTDSMKTEKKFPDLEQLYLTENYLTEMGTIFEVIRAFPMLFEFDFQQNDVEQRFAIGFPEVFEQDQGHLEVVNRYLRGGRIMEGTDQDEDMLDLELRLRNKGKAKGQIENLIFSKQEFLEITGITNNSNQESQKSDKKDEIVKDSNEESESQQYDKKKSKFQSCSSQEQSQEDLPPKRKIKTLKQIEEQLTAAQKNMSNMNQISDSDSDSSSDYFF